MISSLGARTTLSPKIQHVDWNISTNLSTCPLLADSFLKKRYQSLSRSISLIKACFGLKRQFLIHSLHVHFLSGTIRLWLSVSLTFTRSVRVVSLGLQFMPLQIQNLTSRIYTGSLNCKVTKSKGFQNSKAMFLLKRFKKGVQLPSWKSCD